MTYWMIVYRPADSTLAWTPLYDEGFTPWFDDHKTALKVEDQRARQFPTLEYRTCKVEVPE